MVQDFTVVERLAQTATSTRGCWLCVRVHASISEVARLPTFADGASVGRTVESQDSEKFLVGHGIESVVVLPLWCFWPEEAVGASGAIL